MENFQELLKRLSKSKFRSRFRIKPADVEYVRQKGIDTIERHARDFVTKRLAPAEPKNDGKQTPIRGHPVFIAQHATATCCRKCLQKWHKIAQYKALSEPQTDYVVSVLIAWIKKQIDIHHPIV